MATSRSRRELYKLRGSKGSSEEEGKGYLLGV
jgi:hypothetical protein